jgi:choline dehydrogenase-like flavoprotein
MKEYDVIVVGSGPGGTTVAREMNRKGKKVLLAEQGGRWNWLGNTLSVDREQDLPAFHPGRHRQELWRGVHPHLRMRYAAPQEGVRRGGDRFEH